MWYHQKYLPGEYNRALLICFIDKYCFNCLVLSSLLPVKIISHGALRWTSIHDETTWTSRLRMVVQGLCKIFSIILRCDTMSEMMIRDTFRTQNEHRQSQWHSILRMMWTNCLLFRYRKCRVRCELDRYKMWWNVSEQSPCQPNPVFFFQALHLHPKM